LKVGIGATAWNPDERSGLNRYVGEIVSPLAEAFTGAYVFGSAPEIDGQLGARFRRCGTRRLGYSDFVGNAGRLIWHQTALPRKIRQSGVDVFYSPVTEGMLRPPVRQVVTVHDILPLRFPAVYPRLQYYWRHVVPRILAASSGIIAISEATVRGIHEHFPAVTTPTWVVPNWYLQDNFYPRGHAEVEAVRRRHCRGPYLLAVGETRPYKNIRRLIEALGLLDRSDLVLLIVGHINRRDPGIVELPERLGIGGRVRFLSGVSDEDLASLYTGCEAFVFPSLYEGFGLPPLEAMACGAPVVASSATAIPEVCGNAATYFDPMSVESMAMAIDSVLGSTEVRCRLGRAGLHRANTFTRERAVRSIAEVLRAAAA
jgi:glycosyltransferase involved in cell wall biosynthesis